MTSEPMGMDSFEGHELPVWQRPERVETAIWTIRALANPRCEGSEEALEAIMARREMLKAGDTPA